MTLKELIERLQQADQDHVCALGFDDPHSYRGYYQELAFQPKADVSVRDMLACAESAMGATFEGYKGGEFTMNELTDVYLARRGETGEGIGHFLLSYMLGEEPTP